MKTQTYSYTASHSGKDLKIFLLNMSSAIVIIICCSSILVSSSSALFTSSSSLPVRVNPNEQHDSNEALNASLTQTISHKSPLMGRQFGDMINDVHIECNSESIAVTLSTNHGFNGMIYPKGLSKNSTCMTEYHQLTSNITYYLPLRACNTMSSDVEDGIEYFNTIMIQPHRRLVTNQGRGYHIRCRYQTKERTITNMEQQLNINLTQISPAVIGSATMPSCSMKIFSANDLSKEVATENVRIGDELQLVIALDDQDVYGMMVTNCLVRDGMNWGEQPLIDDFGCPVDEEIMPQFVYAANLTKAAVSFQAHKFPYTSSVYYQCNVRLCLREGGCSHVPPNCDKRFDQMYKRVDGSNDLSSNLNTRQKRWLDAGELDAVASEEILKNNPKKDMTIEVYSGLHVDETSATSDKDPLMMASTNDDPSESSILPQPDQNERQADSSTRSSSNKNNKQSERDFCLSMRKFAIAISVASLLLMLAVIAIMACLVHRSKKLRESQRQGASIYERYQAPYTSHSQHNNYAYCRD